MRLGAKVKALHNKIADKGGNFIAKKVMLQPSLDYMKGEQAEMKRQKIMSNREARKMGY